MKDITRRARKSASLRGLLARRAVTPPRRDQWGCRYASAE